MKRTATKCARVSLRFFLCDGCLSGALPEQQVVFETDRQLVVVFEPGQVGADCAADEDVLLEVQRQMVVPEDLLQNCFEVCGHPAEAEQFVRYFEDFVAVVAHEVLYIRAGLCVCGHEAGGFQPLDYIQCLQVGLYIVDKRDAVFVERFFAADAVGEEDDAVRRAQARH